MVEARLEQLSTVGQVQVNLLPSKVAISGVKVRCVYGVYVCLCAFKGVGSGARAPAVCASGVRESVCACSRGAPHASSLFVGSVYMLAHVCLCV